ncbi:MAG: hypothetical protein QOD37_1035, partial [Gaiellales bacterium]|nr:hypothetical protein [Gaiellales bacterium]
VLDGGAGPRVILVDNASEPPVAAPDGCHVVRCEVRLTRGASRNLGLSHVTSEYVVFLDVDDLVLAGALTRLAAGLDHVARCPAIVGRIVEPSGALHRTPRAAAAALARHPRLFAWANATWSMLPTQGCTMMRVSAVRDAGGYADASAGEDWVLGAALAFRGPIAFHSQPALIYRWRPDSPGAARASRRMLLRNAARVRTRLRDDPRVRGGPVAIGLLAGAQALAVAVARPAARLLRRG